ncbi:MAG: hypothetical protein ACYTE8_00480 [Planctomycetota bacterium]|jgi:hypothetical protein
MKQKVWYDNTRFSRYAIIRASYPALKSTVIKSWKNWFKGMVNIVYDTPIRGEIKFPHPDGVSTVEIELVFIALDREEDVNKLQSLELTGMHINEAAEIPRGIHQMSKSRINRYPQEPGDETLRPVKPFIICDYNSVDTSHWLYTIAEEEKPPKHSFYYQPSALTLVEKNDPRIDHDNPIIDVEGNQYIINSLADNVKNVPDDYYQDQVFGARPDWVNIMILNNYGLMQSGRPVYPEFRDDIHTANHAHKPLKGVPLTIGMDLGLTPAAAICQLTPMGEVLVLDELVTEDCSIEKFCEDILKPHLKNNYEGFNYTLIVDPSATKRSDNDMRSAAEVIRAAGLPYRTGLTNNWMKRKESVVHVLRKIGGLILNPHCAYLRKGFISEYHFEKKRLALSAGNSDPKFHEKADKNIYSHIHDALQYAVMELTGGRTAKRRKRLGEKHTGTANGPADSGAGY